LLTTTLHSEENLVLAKKISSISTSALLTVTLQHEGNIAPDQFPSSTRIHIFPTTTLHCEGNLGHAIFTSSTNTSTLTTITLYNEGKIMSSNFPYMKIKNIEPTITLYLNVIYL